MRVVVACLLMGCGARVAPDAIAEDSGVVDSFVADTSVASDTSAAIDTYVPPVDTRPPDPVTCTTVEPPRGGLCTTLGERCAWNSPCGGVDRGVCTSSGWSIDRGVCPPPSKACPATKPEKGAMCPPSSEACLYGNACGGVIAATCTSSGWMLTEFPCKKECPWAAPGIGSACTLPSDVKTCDYTFGPTCSFSCLCYLDRWTCYGTPCTDPPVGSGLED